MILWPCSTLLQRRPEGEIWQRWGRETVKRNNRRDPGEVLESRGIHQDFLCCPIWMWLWRRLLKDKDSYKRGDTYAVKIFKDNCQVGDLERRLMSLPSNVLILASYRANITLSPQAGNVCHFLSSQGTDQMEEEAKWNLCWEEMEDLEKLCFPESWVWQDSRELSTEEKAKWESVNPWKRDFQESGVQIRESARKVPEEARWPWRGLQYHCHRNAC